MLALVLDRFLQRNCQSTRRFTRKMFGYITTFLTNAPTNANINHLEKILRVDLASHNRPLSKHVPSCSFQKLDSVVSPRQPEIGQKSFHFSFVEGTPTAAASPGFHSHSRNHYAGLDDTAADCSTFF